MAKSELTKKKQKGAIITGIISMALNIVPMIVFVIIGFVQGEPKQKLTLGFTAMAALILTVIMLLMKANLKRTIFWILMLGIFICMDKLGYMFIVIAICTIIDELIVSPLHHRYSDDYYTNKQIDKRIE